MKERFPATQDARFIVRVVAQVAVSNEDYFSELDAVVGDGDFGYSIARGFEKVLDDTEQISAATLPGELLREVASIFMRVVGGASGTLWGTAFLRAAISLDLKSSVTQSDVVELLRAAIEGIKDRGGADVRDKTLLDSLVPAADALEGAFLKGADSGTAIALAALAARQGAEATRPMIARRGRASYAGERSIGSLDPGAAAVALMFDAVSKAWNTRADN